MKKTRHTTDQIIEKFHQADIALGKDLKVPRSARSWRSPNRRITAVVRRSVACRLYLNHQGCCCWCWP